MYICMYVYYIVCVCVYTAAELAFEVGGLKLKKLKNLGG